ncbi:hypothetical protein [Motilibacter deserti]|uniref:Uncharacterized protein n=1 Tax=Motilibacter deserti TaxID=2714956 RepID=A0ABX0GYX9_9ACTN|nr:hypothetical protein [Motilibacter deserti]NHC16168.1 hypothetical protein [Motilibacter deserti]
MWVAVMGVGVLLWLAGAVALLRANAGRVPWLGRAPRLPAAYWAAAPLGIVVAFFGAARLSESGSTWGWPAVAGAALVLWLPLVALHNRRAGRRRP